MHSREGSGGGAAGDVAERAGGWPALLRMRPEVVVTNVLVVVAVAWAAVVLVDVVRVLGPPPAPVPLWGRLFNDAWVEWLQWFLLGATVLTGAYLAARLHDRHRGAGTFFLLLAAGVTLMLIEDAGDIRHVLVLLAEGSGASQALGLPVRRWVEVPYFALLAVLPVYALVRYGRHAWASPRARPYLVAGYGLYALAGGASSVRGLGGLYRRLGRWIDENLLASRLPTPEGRDADFAHFYLVDGVIEESVEAVAAACLLALVLAFAADLRIGALQPVEDAGVHRRT